MESDDEPVRERPPAMWLKELMLTEQDEDYDSADDPEFVPPPVLYDSEHEYDEVIIQSKQKYGGEGRGRSGGRAAGRGGTVAAGTRAGGQHDSSDQE